MADWVKIALKTGLVIGVMTALWAVFTQIQIPDPTPSFSYVITAAGFGYTFLNYWIPVFSSVWTIVLVLFSLLVALWTFRFATIAVRWLFKVNE